MVIPGHLGSQPPTSQSITMVFGFGSPLEKNAAKYATPWKEGSQVPQTTLEAQQKLHSYDYGMCGWR